MSNPSAGLVVSVHTRLVRHAKTLGVDPNLILTRFAAERFLYRLSRSRHAERFVLKGALLLLVWLGEAIRPTRDADLLGFGDLSGEALTRTFAEICSIDVEPDGMTYDASSIRVAAIRPEDTYGGQRITLQARLGSARLRVQVDVGIGDIVVPEPEWLDYPSLVGLPCSRLRAYRRETVVAEKVHAMVMLGSKNSRMRDFFDVHALSERESFDGKPLAQALHATFERRRTLIPSRLPLALTPAFAEPREKQAQWQGFLRRNALASTPTDLEQIVATLARFLAPVLQAARCGEDIQSVWPPSGPWQPRGGGDEA